MKSIVLILWLLINIPMFAKSDVARTTIHIRQSTRLSKADVTLGDISLIRTSDTAIEAAIAEIPLGVIPNRDGKIVWSAEEISQMLHPFRQLLREAAIKIPTQVVVFQKEKISEKEIVKSEIETFLRTQVPDISWDITLEDLKIPDDFRLSPDASLAVVPVASRPRGLSQFQIQVWESEKVKRSFYVRVNVKYFASVPIVTRQIQAHSPVFEAGVKWERRDVTFLPEIPATAEELKASFSRKNLIPGEILMRTNLEREMAVKFGEEVSLVAGDENFSILAKGVAQQNAYIGDLVKVKSPYNQKYLNGIVVSKGTVHVQY